FFIIAVQTAGSGISIYCQWELSPGSGNALCILFPIERMLDHHEEEKI
nr:hypothetical protein [Tanacetum cinerariifolium]